jgi:hypothetical protein
MPAEPRPERDLIAHNASFVILWGIPLLVIAVTAVAPVGVLVRAAAWATSFAVAGVACLLNARRSGRVHCQLTGPFFLALSLITAVYGVSGEPFGAAGWWAIAVILVVGTPLLWILSERQRGRYGERESSCC